MTELARASIDGFVFVEGETLPDEINVQGVISRGAELLGVAKRQPDGKYRCLANVGGALALVEVAARRITPEPLRPPDECADRLAWGVAHNAGMRSPVRRVRWAHVMDVTGLGSTSAQQLCRDHGVDPDEEIGGES